MYRQFQEEEKGVFVELLKHFPAIIAEAIGMIFILAWHNNSKSMFHIHHNSHSCTVILLEKAGVKTFIPFYIKNTKSPPLEPRQFDSTINMDVLRENKNYSAGL